MAHVIDAVLQLRDQFTGTLEDAGKQLSKHHKDMLRTGKQIERTGRDLMKVGSSLTKSVTLPLVGIATAAVKVGIDMEDAFSGVKKTVSGTPEQLLAVKRELDTLATQSIPVARKELYGIAETAGQLGVARDDIIGFTETVAKIGRVTNLTYEDGSAALARFANIMGMPMDQMDRLGSTIVKLDNSLATSAAEIVDMGMRLAGAGRQAGLTEAQVLGLAGALSSVGLESQAGGSAFSKVLLNMNSAVFKGGEELRRFAKVAGVTTTEFAAAWREDAAGATTKFVQGLNKLKSEGKNVTGIIEGLGFTELRTRDALLRATEASGLFTDALSTGSKAWMENTALQEVFATRTDNTAAKIDLMKNKLGLASEKLATSLMPHVVKGIDAIGRLADKFAAMSPAQQEMIVRMAATAAAIGPVIFGIGKVTNTVGGVMTTVGKFGKTWVKATADVKKSIKGIGNGAASVKGLMNAIFSPGNRAALVIAGIAAVALLVIKNWDKIGPVVDKVWSRVKSVFGGMGKAAAWVGDQFGAATAWIRDHGAAVKATAGVLAAIFGPALIKTGIEAAIAGTKIAAKFVGSLIKAGAQAVVTSAKFSAHLVKQIVLTGVSAVKTAAQVTGKLVVSLVQYAAQGWKTVASIGATTVAWATQKAAMIGGAIATKVMTAAQWALNVAMNANPVGLVITGVALLAGGLVFLYKKSEAARKIMDAMWNGMKAGAKGAVNFVIGALNTMIRGLNKIQFDVPSWVPLIGGKQWGFDLKEIPKLARGTNYHQGGPALVGERGPELVILPRAACVIPADETVRMLSGTATVRQQVIPAVIPAVRDQIQRIQQEVVPAVVEGPMALVQTIRQELVEIAIPAVRDQIQRIQQEVVPAVVEGPMALVQTIRQELVEIAIPAVRDQIQRVRQQVVPAIVEAPTALVQAIRQELVEVAIPAVRDQLQRIRQEVVPAIAEAPMALVQTIRQELLVSTIPVVRDSTQIIRQDLIAAVIPAVRDQVQIIRQQVIAAMLPDIPGQQQTIRQVLIGAETPRPQTIRQIVERSQQTQSAMVRRDDERTPTRQQVAPNITWAPVFNLGPISSEVDARKLLTQIEDIVEASARNMPRTALELEGA